jgi:outer membrane protein assembly factor BamB
MQIYHLYPKPLLSLNNIDKERSKVMKSKNILTLILIALFTISATISYSEVTTFRYNPKHTGESLYIGPQEPNLMWTYSTGSFITSTPAVDKNGKIYFGNHKGIVNCLSSTGEIVWTYQTGDMIASSPTLDTDGTIYIGSMDNKFYAFNSDGTLKWTFNTSGPIYSSPNITSDAIYFGSDDHKFYALDKTGSLFWTYQTGSWVSSSPAIDEDGSIIFSSYDGKLYSLKSDGTLNWVYETNTYIYSSPAIGNNGTVYFGGYDGKFYAVKNGSLSWSYVTGAIIYSSPSVSSENGNIYFGSNDNTFYALTSAGDLDWSYRITANPEALYNFSASCTIDKNENIYTGCQDGKMYVFDSTGLLQWTYAAFRPIIVASPVLTEDNILYFASTYSGLYALTDISKGAYLSRPGSQYTGRLNTVIPNYPNGFYEKNAKNGYFSANPNDINDPEFSKIFADRLKSAKYLNNPTPQVYADGYDFAAAPPPPTLLDEAMKIIHADIKNFKQDLFYLPSLPYILNITSRVMENPFEVLKFAHEQIGIIQDPASTMYDVIKDGSNLIDEPAQDLTFTHTLSNNPLVDAIEDLYSTFGIPLTTPEIAELNDSVSSLPLVLQKASAFMIYACKEAVIKRDEAFVNLSASDKTFLNNNTIDPVNYNKDLGLQILAITEDIDFSKLAQSGMTIASAIDNIGSVLQSSSMANSLPQYYPSITNPNIEGDLLFYYPTPVGSIIIGGPGKTIYKASLDVSNDKTKIPMFIIDIGGDDEYYNRAGSTFDLKNPVSLVMDLAGNDKYLTDQKYSQGSAKLGVGILLDFAGNDTYTGADFSQGTAYIGFGVLEDKSGDDQYFGAYESQSAAAMGVGILIDDKGNDEYNARTGCQCYAFCKGAAILKEVEGNDFYYAGGGGSAPYDLEPGYERYTSQAQGATFGMRNNYVNEPQAAGGVAMFSDYNGNDIYVGDFYSQGSAYWLGTAVLADSHGDDFYYARQYTQGAGIHLAVGLLLDDSGNDSYITRAVSQGCGHDIGAGLLVDNGGDDIYICQDLSQGGGNDWALSLLSDASGNDQYFGEPSHSDQGFGNFREVMGSIGLLLDASGSDFYTTFDYDDYRHWSKELSGIGIDSDIGDTGVH